MTLDLTVLSLIGHIQNYSHLKHAAEAFAERGLLFFCAITEVLENHQFCFRASLCKLLLALLQQGYRLVL